VPAALGTIEIERCDLSDLDAVRRFAEAFQARNERLDLLVHNVGVLEQQRSHTQDGIELNPDLSRREVRRSDEFAVGS
jgi:NAD(P)-dependent dehydrogenase (short-subunit alcohol dehydrogenase family)